MFTADQVWHAVESLANMRGLSLSAMARLAGLDPTALNPSKHQNEGSDRWLSTRSLSKLLAATNTSLLEFAALVQRQAESRDPIRASEPARGSILFVDDDPVLGGIWTDILRHRGHDVYYAASHSDAMLWLGGSDRIDLLITDVVMPAGAGGLALARMAHAQRRMPVIYITGYDLVDVSFPSDHILLRKPLQPDMLLGTIDRLLQPNEGS